MDPVAVTLAIQQYSALAQIAISFGKLVGLNVRDFVQFLAARNGDVLPNEALDAITQNIMAEDERRLRLSQAESGQ